MRPLLICFLLLELCCLCACSGSESYRGSWKGTDLKGNRVDFVFSENSFIIHETSGTKTEYDYVQNEVIKENGIQIFGIKLGDGRQLQIRFPSESDLRKGFILDANDHVMYTISRDKYLKYEEVYQL